MLYLGYILVNLYFKSKTLSLTEECMYKKKITVSEFAAEDQKKIYLPGLEKRKRKTN